MKPYDLIPMVPGEIDLYSNKFPPVSDRDDAADIQLNVGDEVAGECGPEIGGIHV